MPEVRNEGGKSGGVQGGSAVMCGVCGGDIDYVVLGDAIGTASCKNGCCGGVFVMRAAMEDALKAIAVNDMVVAQHGS